MIFKDFLFVFLVAISGAVCVLFGTHLLLKWFKPDAFKATQPPNVRSRAEVLRQQLDATRQQQPEEALVVPASAVLWTTAPESNERKASTSIGTVLAPGGQNVSSQQVSRRNTNQSALSGATNAALGGTVS